MERKKERKKAGRLILIAFSFFSSGHHCRRGRKYRGRQLDRVFPRRLGSWPHFGHRQRFERERKKKEREEEEEDQIENWSRESENQQDDCSGEHIDWVLDNGFDITKRSISAENNYYYSLLLLPGDPACQEKNQASSRSAYHGLARVIVKVTIDCMSDGK